MKGGEGSEEGRGEEPKKVEASFLAVTTRLKVCK